MTDSFSKTIDYTYDAASNRAGIKYPNGQWVYYDFDQLERMYRVRPWAGGTTTFYAEPSGRVSSTSTLGNGATLAVGFDEGGRLRSAHRAIFRPPCPVALISSHALQLDANGNWTTANVTLPLQPAVTADSYSYVMGHGSPTGSHR